MLEPQSRPCAEGDARLFARNRHKFVRIQGRKAFIGYDCSAVVGQAPTHIVLITIRDVPEAEAVEADAECEDAVRRYFPELFVAPLGT